MVANPISGSSSTAAPTADARPGDIQFGPGAEHALKLFEREIATYLQSLPRLLEEGRNHKHVLIKDDRILSVHDTQQEAIQAGRQQFGLEPIFVKEVDPRDSERFAMLVTAKVARCPP